MLRGDGGGLDQRLIPSFGALDEFTHDAIVILLVVGLTGLAELDQRRLQSQTQRLVMFGQFAG